MGSKWLTAPLLAVALVVVGAVPASANGGGSHQKKLVVDDNGKDCKKPNYTKIQDAVNAATPNTEITVCAGTYVEQVTFADTKDNVDIKSDKTWKAIIKPPSMLALPNAIVHVNGATGVDITGFVISGPMPGPCSGVSAAPSPSELRFGVLVNNNGEAGITGNKVLDIRNTDAGTAGNCQFTNAIQTGTSTGGPGKSTVALNYVERYQKGGIITNEAGSVGNVFLNAVIGLGPTPDLAQNGIQVGFDATGKIEKNAVTKNEYTGTAVTDSAGILITNAAPGTKANHNLSWDNEIGIWVFSTEDSFAQGNRSWSNVIDGIRIQASTVQGPASGNVISGNKSYENGDDGIALSNAASENTVKENKAEDNTGAGVEASSSTSQNQIERNEATGNGDVDCRDDSLGLPTPGTPPTVSNHWIDDIGVTQNVPGLCTPPED